MCVNKYVHDALHWTPTQGVFFPHHGYSWDRVWTHCEFNYENMFDKNE